MTMKTTPTERISFIDTAKGLGIIAVVAGHIYPPGFLHTFIYLFHMPLFFFISGYLFKPKNNAGFAVAKLKQLMVPYFSFLLLAYTLQNRHYFGSETASLKGMGMLYAKALAGGRWLYGYTTAFWFATVLFGVLLMANWLLQNRSRRQVMVAGVLSLILCYLNAAFAPGLKVPFNANVVFAALPVFLAGYYYKQHTPHRHLLGIYLAVVVAVVIACFGRLPALDMKMTVYGWPILSLALAVAMSLLLLAFARWLTRLPLLVRVLNALGSASLVIMFAHQPTQLLLEETLTANAHLRTALALLLPYLFYRASRTNVFGRIFFVGSSAEWKQLRLPGQRLRNSRFFSRKQESEAGVAA